MEHIARMSCSFKVNVHCDGCKRKVMELLQNLGGVYSVAIDVENGTVKVSGRVNPVTILHIFDKYGKHGEIQSVRFDAEEQRATPYNPYIETAYFPFPYEQYYPPYPPFLGGSGYPGYGTMSQYHSLPHLPLPPPPPTAVRQVESVPPVKQPAPPAKASASEPPKKQSCCCTIM